MVIIAVFAGLVVGGGILAFVKNLGKEVEERYTQLNID
jgi:hypothetical protein